MGFTSVRAAALLTAGDADGAASNAARIQRACAEGNLGVRRWRGRPLGSQTIIIVYKNGVSTCINIWYNDDSGKTDNNKGHGRIYV
jgi:hypothetical protein